MTTIGWASILFYIILLTLLTRPVGDYLFAVFERPTPPGSRLMGCVERGIYRICGVDATREHDWRGYALALLAFSFWGILVSYALQRLQAFLPYNPRHWPAVPEDLAWNTAVSFVTNTNWQAYAGESTLGNLTQMACMGWQNFVSAAAAMGVALASARGMTRDVSHTVGNFWVDLVRTILYVLLPMCLVSSLALAAMGVPQTLAASTAVRTLEGPEQVIALGPVASQEAIKQLGTNGGGFFNANSAHPFENPTPSSNFLQMLLILLLPAALTRTYGRMAKDPRQGWAIFAAMGWLLLVGVTATYWAEAQGPSIVDGIADLQRGANMEGKEVRFGAAASALFAVVTTDASCGAVNAMHDSFTALGGLVPLVNIQLGEVVFGGVGAGLYGMLMMVILTVFIAGLMVGRSPEYLGKKIEAREIKWVMLYILVFPTCVLLLTGWSSVAPYGIASLGNTGPHGLSEILYAYTSGAGNNGSALSGLSTNTPWWNASLAVAMLLGRFFMIVPVLAIAGSMAQKKVAPVNVGTFPTHGPLFVFLLMGVIVVVGALTFFPALSLGPIVEHFIASAGRTS